jgi:hypothetical protein
MSAPCLLTAPLRGALRAADAARLAALAHGQREPDPLPLLKLFNPLGAATWLATELAADGDTLFGLADLGFGCPELGSFSLAEIASLRLPYGLAIERDIAFSTRFALSTWADWSRRAGSILWAETLLRRVELAMPPGTTPLPPPANDPAPPDRDRGG